MTSETLEQAIVAEEQLWSQRLQRRILRLLLQHDEALFHRQFRHFFVTSALPPLPLLQQYDRYVRLQTLSNELLDDILPRIRRQLSLKTSHVRLREEAPTRGDIDWPRTIERGWSSAPGIPPLQFDTRLRQRTLETPENLFTVAVLLAFQRELQAVVKENLGDEELDVQERQIFASAEARVQRELAAPYARALLKQASQVDSDALAQQITQHLRPGPYRDLLDWWRRFKQFRVGRANEQRALALASRRSDEKVDAWLYELWIALEFIHLLAREEAIESQDIEIVTDALHCTFVWQQRGFRFLYNRQLDTSTTYIPDWEHGPATRPDYTIERAQPQEIKHQGELIWREPPFVLDAKYYLEGSDPARTHSPLKKLLGDMTLLGAQSGALFFPRLPEPRGDTQSTRIVHRTGTRYQHMGEGPQDIHLYHIEPGMDLPDLQQRLRAILNLACEALPARPAPICEGIYLDSDTINNSRSTRAPNTVLCPKKHIGPNAFDLVDADSDCLKNPRLCHVIDQPIVPPFVVRVTTHDELSTSSRTMRARSDEQLSDAEERGEDTRAEQLRQRIFAGIGRTVEQYVRIYGNTRSIEENFERWVFGPYWQQHPRCLDQATRNSLISGEHVWQNAQEAALQDWAAPAIQYCRALEFELRRRLYMPCPQSYTLTGAGFTLGTITYAYSKHATDPKARAIWNVFLQRLSASGSDPAVFERIAQQLSAENIKEKRNMLAHGGAISKEIATGLRESIIGDRNRPGVLCWIVEHIDVW